jgi:hypothetical protein
VNDEKAILSLSQRPIRQIVLSVDLGIFLTVLVTLVRTVERAGFRDFRVTPDSTPAVRADIDVC